MGAFVEDIFESFLNKKSSFINKDALSISYTPENIPHREEQISNIAKIIAPTLRMEKSSNLFIYGKTGTGKSLCTTYVCNQLQSMAQKKNLPLKVVYINCKMRKVADTEYRLIAQLARQIGQEVPATGLPTDEVYKIFFNAMDGEKKIMILILDEVDRLVKRAGDEILYNLTRINQELKNAKINIIGISNDVLFMKELDPRVKSSLSQEEVIFPPYDAFQINDILTQRAKLAFEESFITPNILSKCSAYAAREHGDARRALDLLRVAGELAERNNKTVITEEDVDLAEEKLEKDTIIEVVKKLPKQSQAVLYATILILKNREPPLFTGEIFDVYKSVCIRTSTKPLTQRRVSDLVAELDMLGIINAKVISKGRYGRTREVTLSITDELSSKVEDVIKEALEI